MNLKKIRKNLFKIHNKKISYKKYLDKKTKDSTVYACYSTGLILKQIYKYIKTKEISRISLGTIRFNYCSKKEYPEIPLAIFDEFEYLSFYWVEIANRYYRKLLNIINEDNVNILDQSHVYFNSRYLIALVELAFRGGTTNFIFISPSTGNKIVDLLFKRHYKKKYSLDIKISYVSRIIKPRDDIRFMYKRVRINKSSFFRPFLIKSNNYVSKNNNKIFIHHQNIKSLEPYNKLFNDLSKNNNFQSLDFISFYEIGSKNKAKFFIDLTKYIINFLKRNFYALIKNNLYLISIQVLSNYIYYLCCINTIKRLNIKKVLVSYIDYDYENLLYKACRDLKIISICCDYSMGYPFTKNFIGRSQIDFNRNSNFVITFGALRCNQYKIYNKFNASHNKLLILTGICPQIDFARDSIKKNDIKIINQNIKENYFNKSLKISIFDNVYGCNFHINKNDIRKCIKALKYSPLEKIILCHNKKFGFLDYYLSNSGLIYKLQTKGDFSNVYYSDFIISVGFQGAALKSAFAFKKPLIFYSQNSRFFEGSNFLFEEKNNNHIIKIIEELTFNYQLLSDAISCKDEYEKFYSKIKSYSKKLLVALDLIEELESTTKLIEKILNEK